MKILKAEIDWRVGWGNFPDLVLTVDKFNLKDTRFRRQDIGREQFMVWGKVPDSDLCVFYVQTSDKRGYGGAPFNLTMEDGSSLVLKGPWSGNALAMNQYFPACTGVIIIETEGSKLASKVSGFHLLAPKFIEQVNLLGEDVALINQYGGKYELGDPRSFELLMKLQRKPDEPIGCFDFKIKRRGKTLKQSQEKKSSASVRS